MVKKIIEIFAAALIVAGIAGLYFRFVGTLPISVTQTQKSSTFDVTGEGKVSVAPDEAQVSMGVRKEAASVATAQKQANQVITELTNRLKALGVKEEDIKTTSYYVSPNYNNQGNPEGYQVNAQLLIKVHDFEKLSDVLDLTGQLGLEHVGGLTFTLSDSLRDKTMADARKEAIDAAKKKAVELAGLSGMKLGRIVDVQEGGGRGVTPIYNALPTLDAAGSSAKTVETPVSPGTTDVSVNVTLSYETF